LNLSKPITPGSTVYIIGAGAASTIVDANQLDNVLDVRGLRTAWLSGLTLRNGRSVNSASVE
jgi:hypothetical protein